MLSISLCVVFAALCFFAGRQSLVNGIGATLAVGYAYGIARANLPQTGSHFFFDSAVAGLFAARITAQHGDGERRIPRQLLLWVAALIAWPLFLLAVPKQDTLVQLVGLRGNAFLLPFILLGAQLLSSVCVSRGTLPWYA